MANALDMLGRAALQIMGYTPQQIRQMQRANKTAKPMPKPAASKPAVTPKPATPTSVVGQTNLFNQSGKPRDFRNPNVAGNRPPTVTKPQLGPPTPLKPGPVRPAQVAPGQMSIFGTNPGAKPGGNFRAPRVPKPGAGTIQGSAQAMDWLKANSAAAKEAAAVNRAVRAQTTSNALFGGTSLAVPILQLANAVQDRMLSPEQLKIKQANSISKENMFKPFQTREQVLGLNQQYGPPSPQMYGPGGSPTGSGLGQAQQVSPTSSVEPGGLFYRGGGQAPAAPTAAAPAAQPSVYAPRASEAPRANSPKPAPQPAANPYAGIGDVRGNELGAAPTGSVGVDKQNLGAPRTPTDPDYERRRAFLDAPDSLSGMQAVRDLLKRRKLSISVSD